MSRPVFGVVEIGGDPMLLLIAGVFIVTFITVCAAAYLLLVKRRTDGTATTWKFQLQSRLPVSKRTFEQISHATTAATARPDVSAATQAQLNQLGQVRGAFVSVYRVLMIVVGLAGLTAGILLLRSHTPANMQGLPGAIVLLFSLGALRGIPIADAARAVHPGYADLSEMDRRSVEFAIAQATGPQSPDPP